MQALVSVWQDLNEQWQIPEWVIEPIGEQEHDMLQLVLVARPNITYADTYADVCIVHSIVDYMWQTA